MKWQYVMSTVCLALSVVGCMEVNQNSALATASNATMTQKVVASSAATGAALGTATDVGLPMGTAIGAVVGGALGQYFSKNTPLVQKIQMRGIGVYELGDQIRLLIPSQLLFYGTTETLLKSAYPSLDLVAELLQGIEKVSIKVVAYAAGDMPTESALLLTQGQADSVANYLWRQGVEASLMYSVGYGSGYPVTTSADKYTFDINSRVEILLENVADKDKVGY